MGRQSTTEDDTLKKKFSATAKIAALLSSGSSSKSDTSVFGEKSSGKKSSGIVMKSDYLSRVWDWVEFGLQSLGFYGMITNRFSPLWVSDCDMYFK